MVNNLSFITFFNLFSLFFSIVSWKQWHLIESIPVNVNGVLLNIEGGVEDVIRGCCGRSIFFAGGTNFFLARRSLSKLTSD